MSSTEGSSRRSSPFDDPATDRFFYWNLANREVFAALRYGIEARRGLLLLTGEAGTGKSALLDELARAASSQLVVIPISGPRRDFSDLLALLLQALDVGIRGGDEASRIHTCQAALRSGFEANRIVALAVDDAEDLDDETIEALTRHFLGEGFDPENNLLQIVLAGRPELRERLMRPPLRSLPTQVEIACRLRPLAAKDVERYIRHRLAAADWRAQLFDDDAIGLIAACSDGRPSIVNAICKHALDLEHPGSDSGITSATVARAARELDLAIPGGPADRARADESESAPPAEARRACSSVVASGGFGDAPAGAARPPLAPRASRRTVSAGLILLFITLLAAWLDGVPVLSYGRNLGEKLGELAVLTPGNTEPAPAPATAPPAENRTRAGAKPKGATSAASQPAVPRHPSGQQSFGASKDSLVESAADSAAAAAAARKPEPATEEAKRPPQRDLAKAVSRAIANRAILGVSVSVDDRAVYLDGRVPTRTQKDAAERAARAVAGVRELQNRITIE